MNYLTSVSLQYINIYIFSVSKEFVKKQDDTFRKTFRPLLFLLLFRHQPRVAERREHGNTAPEMRALIPAHLADELNLPKQSLYRWDPLHKGGIVDTHIREDISSSWLVELQNICKETHITFNWGKNYENFLKVCKDLDIVIKKKLTNGFQTTRFANSIRND